MTSTYPWHVFGNPFRSSATPGRNDWSAEEMAQDATDRRRVVVVVEDDRPVGELLASIINDEEGYYAIHVTRPSEALETLKKIKPDLLVLDVGLPGMSGIELYDRVRQDDNLKRVPVMFETAVASEHRMDFKRRGIDRVIEKPFELDEIVRAVRELAPRPH